MHTNNANLTSFLKWLGNSAQRARRPIAISNVFGLPALDTKFEIAVWTSSMQYIEQARIANVSVVTPIDCGSSSNLSFIGFIGVHETEWLIMLTVDQVFSPELQNTQLERR